MEKKAPDHNVGSSVPVLAIVATVVALAVIIGGFLAYRSLSGERARHQIVIATGSEAGTYYALGEALGRVLEAEGVARSVRVLETDGSVANMQLIGRAKGPPTSRSFRAIPVSARSPGW